MPGNDALYLLQEFALTGLLGDGVQIQAGLLHGDEDAIVGLRLPHRRGGLQNLGYDDNWSKPHH